MNNIYLYETKCNLMLIADLGPKYIPAFQKVQQLIWMFVNSFVNFLDFSFIIGWFFCRKVCSNYYIYRIIAQNIALFYEQILSSENITHTMLYLILLCINEFNITGVSLTLHNLKIFLWKMVSTFLMSVCAWSGT